MLVDNRVNNKKENIDVVSITQEGEGKLNELHYTFPFKFVSIFGMVGSIENVMLFLNKENFPISKLGKILSNKEKGIIKKKKSRSIPNYWFLIELVTLDRILADKELVNIILKDEDLANKKIYIYDKIHKGIIDTIIPTEKNSRYGYILRMLFQAILDYSVVEGYKSVEDITKYKDFKNDIKEIVFNTLMEIKNTPFLEGVTDTTDEELKEKYLS